MDIRSQFEAAAGYAVYAFLNQINLLAERDSVREALKDSPIQLTKGRQLEDIALDDMMERFAFVMRESKEEQAVPKLLFYMLMVKRYGVDISPDEANGELKRMMAEYKSPKRVLKQPVPDFLQVLENAVHMPELAEITNQYNTMFQSIVRLATSDSALSVYDKNMGAQNRMVGVINETIKAKNKGNSGKATNSARGGGYGGGRGSDDDDDDDEGNDLDKLAKRIKALNMPDKIKEEVMALLKTTRRLNPQMSEFNVNCKRLDIIASLPWGIFKEMNGDINKAQEILDDDHYGLDKVKEQIIQHMAVQNRTGQPNGKIMLLVGPPGVGKTSIAQSVAKATGREYIRISLGGVSKESDIRGHSSTFVGAMPGRIIQELKKAKSSNALVVLDEIDKLGSGGTHGDPSAALLEVLDPAQNHTFRDDYLGVEFDLSKVLFFATANEFGNIPGPLRDRMQVLHLSGYTKDEKFEIAQRYLVPKQMKANKLDDTEIVIPPETIKAVIKHHTSEAGVRTLEKKIGEICGKAVVDIAKGKEGLTTVTPDNLETFIGVGHGAREKIPAEDSVGIVSGLFYSAAGGGILPIEASLMPSPGGFRMTVSGSLGKVMGESAGVAERLVRTRAPEFGIPDTKILKAELSVHCPDGATPKDGPSAGAAFTTAIISSFTGIPIRRDVAMTGEINSKGQVTAIGGLQQKLEGALEAGVKTVLIPKENIPNLRDVSEKVKSQLTIIPVGTIEEVLKHALTEEIKPLSAPKAEAPLGFWPRLRKAWDVVAHGTPSNDNQPQPVRQAAGARRGHDTHTP